MCRLCLLSIFRRYDSRTIQTVMLHFSQQAVRQNLLNPFGGQFRKIHNCSAWVFPKGDPANGALLRLGCPAKARKEGGSIWVDFEPAVPAPLQTGGVS